MCDGRAVAIAEKTSAPRLSTDVAANPVYGTCGVALSFAAESPFRDEMALRPDQGWRIAVAEGDRAMRPKAKRREFSTCLNICVCQKPPVQIVRRLTWMRKVSLRYAHDSADLERRAIRENVLAINRTPFVPLWWCAQMVLVVIDFIAAIPVFVFDGRTFLPFFVLDVRVVVVVVLGEGDATHKACRKDCKC